jgi:CheY-like chemotaxis protein
MNSTQELRHQINDPALTHSERARHRCQLAKHLEEVGNYEAACEAMGDLWPAVGSRPLLEGLSQTIAAEVLLRAGVLTGWIGSCKQIGFAQETAKNLISESHKIFETLGDTLKAAEAQMELGHCYWREGAYNESRVWLKEALSRLPDEAGDVKIVTLSRLATIERGAKRLSDAYRLLTEAVPLIEVSDNYTLKGNFRNQLALVLRNLSTVEQREDYLDRALIEYAAASFHFEQAGHSRHQARVENNLGFLYGTIKRFPEAHEHLDRAQALFTSLKDKTHVAQVDDTRARVLLEEGRIAEAEKLARAAVQGLDGSDQQVLLAEALITHGIALAQLERYEDARQTLRSAIEVGESAGDTETAGRAALTTIEEIGEHLSDNDLSQIYELATDLLGATRDQETLLRLSTCASRVLFLIGASSSPTAWKDFSLKDALRRYEARLIERALKDAGGIVSRAAQLLGFKNHNSLIKILNTRHRHLLPSRSPIRVRRRSLISVPHADRESRPLAILHVEDSDFVAKAVRETLELKGWTVETIVDGTTALRIIQGDAHYDILILDNELPGISGLELIIQTRSLTHRQHTPIVMLSTRPIEGEALTAGANVCLWKPEDIATIALTIANLVAQCSEQPLGDQ